MTQIASTPAAACSEFAGQLAALLIAQSADEANTAIESMEKAVNKANTINTVMELEECVAAAGSNVRAAEVLRTELYAVKKRIKSLSEDQKADIAARRQLTKDTKVLLQLEVKSLTNELKIAERREQDAAKVVRTTERVQRRQAKAEADAQKAAERQARRDAKAMQEAEKADARKAREEARSIKRQMALNSAAARTAAAKAREEAAAAALAAVAQPVKRVRVPRVKKVEVTE